MADLVGAENEARFMTNAIKGKRTKAFSLLRRGILASMQALVEFAKAIAAASFHGALKSITRDQIENCQSWEPRDAQTWVFEYPGLSCYTPTEVRLCAASQGVRPGPRSLVCPGVLIL